MAYRRITFTMDLADLERFAGRLVIASKNAGETDEGLLSVFMGGGAAAIYTLLKMENGTDEEGFATLMLNWYTGVTNE